MKVFSVLVKEPGKGTQAGNEKSSTRECMIELSELVAAILKGSVKCSLALDLLGIISSSMLTPF